MDRGHVAGKGAMGPGVSRALGDGFARIGVSGVGGFACKEFSCMSDNESGEGAVRSDVDAAQSQWVEREPYRLWYWCAARNLGAQGPDDCRREVLMHFSSTKGPAS